MNKFSSSFKLNGIHIVDSSFNEDPIFSRKALITGDGRPENLGKMGNNRDIYCYVNREVVNLEREYQPLPPYTKILVILQFFYMSHQIFGKKFKKKSIFRPKFDLSLGSSLPKYKDVFKKFLYGQTFFVKGYGVTTE